MSSSFEDEPQVSVTRTDTTEETTSKAPSGENQPQISVTKTAVSTTTVEVSGADSDTEAQAIADELSEDLTKIGRGLAKSLTGFRTFILRGNVIDLAIGIVIGAAFTSVVTSLVSDVITPLIPLPGKNSLGLLTIPLPGFYPTGSVIHIGLFINAIISFLIVAAVLYFFVVQPVSSLMNLYKPKTEEKPEMRECPDCLQSVNSKATRCPYCTSYLAKDGTAHSHRAEEEQHGLMLPVELESLSDKLAEKITAKTKPEVIVEGPSSEGTPEK